MGSDSPAWVELRAKTPADWEVSLLAEVTDFQEGPGILAKDFAESGVPLLRLRNIEGPNVRLDGCNYLAPAKVEAKWKHFALAPGDLLISTSASLGRVSVVDANSAGAIAYTGIIRFRSRSQRLHHEYLRAFLSSRSFVEQAERMATGSVIKHFGPSHLRQMAIALPPIGTQVRIAELFDALDDRITLLRETNATLEAIAQALFKSWFVDFDPVRAKRDGHAPDGMDEATAALFPDSFEDSELGEVPRGWRCATVSDICSTITNGGTPSRSKAEYWEPGRVPWFKTGEFNDGFLLESSEQITEAALTGSSVKLLPAEAVLMAIYAAPTVGRLGVTTTAATFNQACTGMVAKPEVGTWFLYWTLYFGRDWFNSRANGAAQQNISKGIVSGYKLAVPGAGSLKAFDEIAGALHRRIRANSEQALSLSRLRDTILPRLISGQLRLPESTEAIEPALA